MLANSYRASFWAEVLVYWQLGVFRQSRPSGTMRCMKLPRFKLRTLFLFVAVFAVASWVYFIVWPWWQYGREQAQFVESINRIKSGMTIWQAATQVKNGSDLIGFQDEYHHNTIMVGYAWPNNIYCVFYETKRDDWAKTVDPDARMTKIEVFRLEPMPINYRPTLTNPRRTLNTFLSRNRFQTLFEMAPLLTMLETSEHSLPATAKTIPVSITN